MYYIVGYMLVYTVWDGGSGKFGEKTVDSIEAQQHSLHTVT